MKMYVIFYYMNLPCFISLFGGREREHICVCVHVHVRFA